MSRDFLAGAAFVVGVSLLFWSAETPAPSRAEERTLPRYERVGAASTAPSVKGVEAPTPTTHATVARVIDGDTILLADGRQVRYIGVDTPEVSDARLARAARDATEANRQLVEGKSLELELDVQPLDRYGRTLAYVWADGMFVNEELLRYGWARLLTIPPDVRYVDQFRRVAQEGAERRERIWTPQAGTASEKTGSWNCPNGLPIKGNVSASGERIFHIPGGDFYARTFPEECFADAGSAERAGYRASRR